MRKLFWFVYVPLMFIGSLAIGDYLLINQPNNYLNLIGGSIFIIVAIGLALAQRKKTKNEPTVYNDKNSRDVL